MSKNFKVESSINNNVLVLSITGRIWQGELANVIRLNIDNALENNVEELLVLMSCEGGSTFEAEDVKNEFKRFAKRKIRVGALAASAATNILTEFEDSEAYSTSQFMIHKPSSWFSGNEDKVQAELRLLKNITDTYRSVYAKKFKKTEQEIEDLWKNDYWITATEAKELGLINNIIDEELEINSETISAIVAVGAPIVPKKSTKQKPEIQPINNKMDKNQLIAALGMPADSTDEQISARIQENKAKADSATAVESKADLDKKTAATKFAAQAVFDKKIKATDMPAYEALHLQNTTEAEKLVAELPKLEPGSAFVNPSSVDATDRSKWTLEDYLDKNPTALEELIKTDPAKVKELNAAYALKK